MSMGECVYLLDVLLGHAVDVQLHHKLRQLRRLITTHNIVSQFEYKVG
jgi:hypothetical protein